MMFEHKPTTTITWCDTACRYSCYARCVYGHCHVILWFHVELNHWPEQLSAMSFYEHLSHVSCSIIMSNLPADSPLCELLMTISVVGSLISKPVKIANINDPILWLAAESDCTEFIRGNFWRFSPLIFALWRIHEVVHVNGTIMILLLLAKVLLC